MLATVGSYSRKAARPSFYDTLRKLHLLDNLRLCLDAGDRLSFEGGADMWRDRSGGGYDFFLGSGTGADAADPTHNGVSGRRTKDEYFSYDGGDLFTLGQSNPSWVNGIHKDNAVFTIVEWVYANAISAPTTDQFGEIGTAGTSTGFTFSNQSPVDNSVTNPLKIGFFVFNGASVALEVGTTAVANNNAWNMIGISLTEATGVGVFQINATQETLSGKTYSSPSASNAANTLQIGSLGGAFGNNSNGVRNASVAMWDRALSASELASIYNATKGKFGL